MEKRSKIISYEPPRSPLRQSFSEASKLRGISPQRMNLPAALRRQSGSGASETSRGVVSLQSTLASLESAGCENKG